MKQAITAILLLCSVALAAQPNCAIAYNEGSNRITYNESEIEKLIDFSKYKAIFYGEGHIRDFEPEFKYRFITHFHTRFQIKDVFMEIGYAAAYYYNWFLQSGDTNMLNRIKMPYNQRSYRTFWYRLYLYNKAQPSKITIHGIDFERTELLQLLEGLRKKDAVVPQYLQATFADIARLSKDPSLFAFDKDFKKEMDNIREVFRMYEHDVKAIYGDDYTIISLALNNKAPVTTQVKPRNKVWLHNMNEIITANHIDKFVGFFGKSHLSYDSPTSLAVTLQEDERFKGTILNIMGIYHHFLSYGYMGDAPKIFDYAYQQKEVYEKYADENCRATLLPADKIAEGKLAKRADFILFAKDVVVE